MPDDGNRVAKHKSRELQDEPAVAATEVPVSQSRPVAGVVVAATRAQIAGVALRQCLLCKEVDLGRLVGRLRSVLHQERLGCADEGSALQSEADGEINILDAPQARI